MASPPPVNAIAGDASFLEAYGRAPTEADAPVRVRVHLTWVIRQLRAAPAPRPELQALRDARLDALERYTIAGDFPVNRRATRRPRFRDEAGRWCAVGFLMSRSDPALARAIADRFEYELLLDMRDPRLDAWIASSGFTARELAMIQPAYEPSLHDVPRLMEAGRYEEALRHLERAYAISPRPQILYPLAICADRSGRYDRAIDAYRRYVQEMPEVDPARRAEIDARITELEHDAEAHIIPRPVPAGVSHGCACRASPSRSGGLALAIAALFFGIARSSRRSISETTTTTRSRRATGCGSAPTRS